jgi:hypothetical protein
MALELSPPQSAVLPGGHCPPILASLPNRLPSSRTQCHGDRDREDPVPTFIRYCSGPQPDQSRRISNAFDTTGSTNGSIHNPVRTTIANDDSLQDLASASPSVTWGAGMGAPAAGAGITIA